MKHHYNIKVKGRVQGVFYRASAKQQAAMLGITGFIRNEKDGSVYIEAEADEEALTQFVEWCHEGPERAEVEAVSIDEGDLLHFAAFEVKKD